MYILHIKLEYKLEIGWNINHKKVTKNSKICHEAWCALCFSNTILTPSLKIILKSTHGCTLHKAAIYCMEKGERSDDFWVRKEMICGSRGYLESKWYLEWWKMRKNYTYGEMILWHSTNIFFSIMAVQRVGRGRRIILHKPLSNLRLSLIFLRLIS